MIHYIFSHRDQSRSINVQSTAFYVCTCNLHNDQDMGRLATKQTNEKARISKIEMAHMCACVWLREK